MITARCLGVNLASDARHGQPFFLVTLPMYIYSTMRRGITPEIDAVATIIVVLSLGLIVLSVYLLKDSKEE